MILKKLSVGSVETNCYILGCQELKEAIIIDPGGDYKLIKTTLDKYALMPKLIINTHGHIDHIGANDNFAVPKYIHRLDADFLTDPVKNLSFFMFKPMKFSKADFLLDDEAIISIGKIRLKVIHTPGHTPGSITLACGNILFTGDTLFCNGVGRTDFGYASKENLITSIKTRLFKFGDDTVIHPGHGPSSTIGQEKAVFASDYI